MIRQKAGSIYFNDFYIWISNFCINFTWILSAKNMKKLVPRAAITLEHFGGLLNLWISNHGRQVVIVYEAHFEIFSSFVNKLNHTQFHQLQRVWDVAYGVQCSVQHEPFPLMKSRRSSHYLAVKVCQQVNNTSVTQYNSLGQLQVTESYTPPLNCPWFIVLV